MPDKTGKLTDADLAKVVDWLSKYTPGGDAKCPLCGSTEWAIGHHLLQPVTLGGNLNLQLAGIGYPQVALMSIPCGYTMFVNAVVAGVLQSNSPVTNVGDEKK